jgi:hypothetical protein
MGWQDAPIVGAAAPASTPAWASAPVVHRFGSGAAGMQDVVGAETVPTGSAYAQAQQSPIARPDQNSNSPVGSEIGAMASNAFSGTGKAFVDLARGAGQYLGVTSRQDVQDSRERDAPLMATGAGKVGNFVGNVAATLPALAIPGANTVVGAGAIGAATGALQPSTSTGETIRNTALGGALGAGGQAVGNAVSAGAQRILASRAAKATDDAAQNSVRDATLKTAQDAGYVIPPANVNEGVTAHALEGVSGKIATEQVARVRNQAVTDKLVRQDLNLPKNAPLTPETFANVRADAGKVYAQVKQESGPIKSDAQFLDDVTSLVKSQNEVSKAYPGAEATAGPKIEALADSLMQDTHSAPQLLEYSKQLRNQAKGNFVAAGRGDPEARALAQAQWDASGALEDLMKRNLEAQGKTALANSFDAARTTIAKAHTAENALIEGQGHIDAKVLGRQLKRGVPLSDGFDTAARFAQAFPKAAGIPQGSAGVSKLTAVTTLEALSHGKLGLAAALAASSPTRSAILSGLGQRVLATPNYAPGRLGTAALQALKQSPRAVLPATAATLPLIQSGQ